MLFLNFTIFTHTELILPFLSPFPECSSSLEELDSFNGLTSGSEVQWPRVGQTGSNWPLLLSDKTGSATADYEERPGLSNASLYSLRTSDWPSDPLTRRKKAGSRVQTKPNLPRIKTNLSRVNFQNRPELQTKSHAVDNILSYEAHENSDKMLEAVTKVIFPVINQ